MVFIKATYIKHRQLILYATIGLVGASIDFVFYILFYKTLGIPPVIASFLSVSLGIINNFIINSKINFKVFDLLFYRFLNFYAIGLGGAVVSSILILILFNGVGIDATIAKIITIAPVVLVQFYLNKRFSFKKIKKTPITKARLYIFLTNHKFFLIVLLIFVGSFLSLCLLLSLYL